MGQYLVATCDFEDCEAEARGVQNAKPQGWVTVLLDEHVGGNTTIETRGLLCPAHAKVVSVVLTLKDRKAG